MPNPPAPTTTALGAAIRLRRADKAQAALADSLGVATLTLSRIERGQHLPSVATARKLAAWLSWTVEQVLDAAEAPAPRG